MQVGCIHTFIHLCSLGAFPHSYLHAASRVCLLFHSFTHSCTQPATYAGRVHSCTHLFVSIARVQSFARPFISTARVHCFIHSCRQGAAFNQSCRQGSFLHQSFELSKGVLGANHDHVTSGSHVYHCSDVCACKQAYSAVQKVLKKGCTCKMACHYQHGIATFCMVIQMHMTLLSLPRNAGKHDCGFPRPLQSKPHNALFSCEFICEHANDHCCRAGSAAATRCCQSTAGSSGRAQATHRPQITRSQAQTPAASPAAWPPSTPFAPPTPGPSTCLAPPRRPRRDGTPGTPTRQPWGCGDEALTRGAEE